MKRTITRIFSLFLSTLLLFSIVSVAHASTRASDFFAVTEVWATPQGNGKFIVEFDIGATHKDVYKRQLCDRKGAIYAGRSDDMNWIKEEMAQVTNPEKRTGSLADVLAGADVFIGVSAPGVVTKEMVQTMNAGAVIFACANPTPEIFPDDARAGGAAVVRCV